MKKVYGGIILLFAGILLFSACSGERTGGVKRGKPVSQIKASDLKGDPEATVVVHYRRSDSAYSTWGLWLWSDEKDGRLVKFDGVDAFGAYKNVYLKSGKIGFITRRLSSWSKDVDKDRFWEKGMPKHIFLQSGQEPVFTSAAGALLQKIISAEIVGLRKIRCFLTANAGRVKKRAVTIIDASGKRVALSSLSMSDAKTLIVKTAKPILPGKKYILTIKGFTGSAAPGVAASLLEGRAFTYRGRDLGAVYTPGATTFKVWAPVADRVELCLYRSWDSSQPYKALTMNKRPQGIWGLRLAGNRKGLIYNYRILKGGDARNCLDPYGKGMTAFKSGSGDAVGRNVVVDLRSTDPSEWDKDRYVRGTDPRDTVVYEIHIRDFTISPSSGVAKELRGTYLGFIKKIPYLKELGITHVQLLPVMNFYYGNEMDKRFENAENGSPGFRGANYNWGYDPHSYFAPEGWYSLNPEDAHARIKELKRLVQALHKAGIGVILDVVYNHTATTDILNNLAPGYYYRMEKNGSYCNGSGCGNEVASRRPMVRKLILDSLEYWTREFHIDGFRFDLLGLTDEKTMQKAYRRLQRINPSIILHGEGWNVGSYLPVEQKFVKVKSALKRKNKGIAVFNDGIRDALKSGGLGAATQPGFVTGDRNQKPYVKMSLIGSIVSYLKDREIKNFKTRKDYITTLQKSSKPPTARNYCQFAFDSSMVLNYISCHDNRTLWDKIRASALGSGLTRSQYERMHRLANFVLFVSQGRLFLHAGSEFQRSKPNQYQEKGYDHNSYDSGDNVNALDWSLVQKNRKTFEYIKGLITIRRAHRAFRLRSAREIIRKVTFLNVEGDDRMFISMKIRDPRESKGWKSIIVLINGNRKPKTVQIPEVAKGYRVVADGDVAGKELSQYKLAGGSIIVPALSGMILTK